MDSVGVKVMIVLTWAKGSLFLGDKEEGRGLQGFKRDDATSFEIFFNECGTGLFFLGIEGVYLGDLGYKCIFQVNGVISGGVVGHGLI